MKPKLETILIAILLIILAIICADGAVPMPKKPKPFLKSPRASALASDSIMVRAAALPSDQWHLEWTQPDLLPIYPARNVVDTNGLIPFVVLGVWKGSDDLKTWTRIATLPASPIMRYSFTSTGRSGFYKVSWAWKP